MGPESQQLWKKGNENFVVNTNNNNNSNFTVSPRSTPRRSTRIAQRRTAPRSSRPVQSTTTTSVSRGTTSATATSTPATATTRRRAAAPKKKTPPPPKKKAATKSNQSANTTAAGSPPTPTTTRRRAAEPKKKTPPKKKAATATKSNQSVNTTAARSPTTTTRRRTAEPKKKTPPPPKKKAATESNQSTNTTAVRSPPTTRRRAAEPKKKTPPPPKKKAVTKSNQSANTPTSKTNSAKSNNSRAKTSSRASGAKTSSKTNRANSNTVSTANSKPYNPIGIAAENNRPTRRAPSPLPSPAPQYSANGNYRRNTGSYNYSDFLRGPEKQKYVYTNTENPHQHPDIGFLYNFNGTDDDFMRQVRRLRKKYADNPAMAQQVERARYFRHLGVEKRLVKKGICHNEMQRGQNPFIRPCWQKIDTKVKEPLEAAQSGGWGCDANAPTLGAHQIVHSQVARMIAHAGKPGPNKRRGLLVYTNTGSGKTNSALGIALAFWDSKLPIYMVTTKENAKNNPASEYAENCLLFYPDAAESVFRKTFTPPRDMWNRESVKSNQTFQHEGKTYTVASWCNEVGGRVMSKRVKGLSSTERDYMSFRVFGGDKTSTKSGLDTMKDGGVLIIDEAQNLYKPRSTDPREVAALNNIRRRMVTQPYMQNSYVFALTATPGDTASQVINLINLVRPYGMPEITVRQFVNDTQIIRGLVSYADIRGDTTKYGSIVGGEPKNLYIPMTPSYWAAFLLKFMEQQQKPGGVHKLDDPDDVESSKNFFGSDLRNGCMLPKTAFTGMPAAATANTVKLANSQYVLSEKMKVLLDNVRSIDGCQYIYVRDPIIVAVCVAYMINREGYSMVNPNRLGNVIDPGLRVLPIKDTGELTIAGQTIQFTDGNVKQAIKLFKSNANSNGELIKVCIGTKFEGLDMSYLQAVHIVTPLPTVADDDQAVGRALRFCGHRPDKKDVVVYRYFSTPPPSMQGLKLTPLRQNKVQVALDKLQKYNPRGVNAHVHKDALRRGEPLKQFMRCVQGQSIECEIRPGDGGLLDPLQKTKVHCGIPQCPVTIAGNELVIREHRPSPPPAKANSKSIEYVTNNDDNEEVVNSAISPNRRGATNQQQQQQTAISGQESRAEAGLFARLFGIGGGAY